jgi:hypothetical protein
MYFIMKKSKHTMTLIITVILLNTILPVPILTSQSLAAPKLSDVAGNWAEREIIEWIGKGYINGYPDGTFRPNSFITRAEFVALVNRVFKFSVAAAFTFDDVKADGWYSMDAAIAEKAGYLSELEGDGSFILSENISRQEAAAIIFSLKSLTKDENEASKFADAAKISEHYRGYIGAVTKAGCMKCYPDGNFGPENNLTRAEAVVLLNNIIKMSDQ